MIARATTTYARLPLTAIAGVGRLPQISMPLGNVNGVPIGLSLVAARGADRYLVRMAKIVAERFGVTRRSYGSQTLAANRVRVDRGRVLSVQRPSANVLCVERTPGYGESHAFGGNVRATASHVVPLSKWHAKLHAIRMPAPLPSFAPPPPLVTITWQGEALCIPPQSRS